MAEQDFDKQFQRLLQMYRKERFRSEIKEDDLKILLVIFPGILVAQADGFIDTTEMVYLVRLTKDLAKAYNYDVSDNLKDEMRYLTRNTAFWFDPFTATLKLLIQKENRGVDVADIMVMVASSSSGDLINNVLYSSRSHNLQQRDSVLLQAEEDVEFLSEEEKEDIRKLARKLGLYEVKEAAQRLKSQLDG